MGALAGAEGPAAQQAGGTQHAPLSKMHARQPPPASHKQARHPDGWPGLAMPGHEQSPQGNPPQSVGAGHRGAQGASWGPKSPVRVLLVSWSSDWRQFGRSGGPPHD